MLAAGDVRPEDILVVTPDIDASAGVIEAVMSAQPAERRIAWTVLSPASRAEALARRLLGKVGEVFVFPCGDVCL